MITFHKTVAKHRCARIISIGHRCSSAIAIKGAGFRKESFPFDWAGSQNSHNVFAAIEDDLADFMPERGHLINRYGIGLPHLDASKSIEENEATMKRRCDRFLDVLRTERRKVLLVYANEDYLYSEAHRGVHSRKLFDGVLSISQLLRHKYPHLDFHILYIDGVVYDHTPFVTSVAMLVNTNDLINEKGSKASNALGQEFRWQLSKFLRTSVSVDKTE